MTWLRKTPWDPTPEPSRLRTPQTTAKAASEVGGNSSYCSCGRTSTRNAPRKYGGGRGFSSGAESRPSEQSEFLQPTCPSLGCKLCFHSLTHPCPHRRGCDDPWASPRLAPFEVCIGRRAERVDPFTQQARERSGPLANALDTSVD